MAWVVGGWRWLRRSADKGLLGNNVMMSYRSCNISSSRAAASMLRLERNALSVSSSLWGTAPSCRRCLASSTYGAKNNQNHRRAASFLKDLDNKKNKKKKKNNGLKPSLIASRLSKLRTYVGTEKSIRHSPWRLNLICQFVSKQTQTVAEALDQLLFVEKSRAPLIRNLIVKTAGVARDRHGLLPSQLHVAECFATHGPNSLKRLRYHGRGRSGRMTHKLSHVRLVLRELDFALQLALCPNEKERREWLRRQDKAQAEYEASQQERTELEELERQAQEAARKRAESAKKEKAKK